jgi:hypothetical protein
MTHEKTESPTDDLAYLTRPQHRIPALVALTVPPKDHSERCELIGVPSSTIRRILNKFDDEEEGCFLSSHQETTPVQYDECAVTCLNSVTRGSGDGCWTRWDQ